MDRRWMSLTTYIALITGINKLPIKVNNTFNFDAGKEWRRFAKPNDLAIKAATIVMFDRWSDKHDQRRV